MTTKILSCASALCLALIPSVAAAQTEWPTWIGAVGWMHNVSPATDTTAQGQSSESATPPPSAAAFGPAVPTIRYSTYRQSQLVPQGTLPIAPAAYGGTTQSVETPLSAEEEGDREVYTVKDWPTWIDAPTWINLP